MPKSAQVGASSHETHALRKENRRLGLLFIEFVTLPYQRRSEVRRALHIDNDYAAVTLHTWTCATLMLCHAAVNIQSTSEHVGVREFLHRRIDYWS